MSDDGDSFIKFGRGQEMPKGGKIFARRFVDLFKASEELANTVFLAPVVSSYLHRVRLREAS